MMMSFQLRATLAWECSLCKQNRDGERVKDISAAVILFGAKRYTVCPNCFQDVPDELNTQGYRKRYDKRRPRQPEHILAGVG
jgi:hypothetical protein